MRYFRFRVRVFGCRRAGTGAARRDRTLRPSRTARSLRVLCRVSAQRQDFPVVSEAFRPLRAVGTAVLRSATLRGGGRVRPRNAIRTAEPLRTGSGLESRDNGKYGCPGHKGRVMNMRWGRFGSINICLLIDWCNEPTKKIRLARAACLLVGSARRESRPAVGRSGFRGRSFRSCRVGIQNFYVAV